MQVLFLNFFQQIYDRLLFLYFARLHRAYTGAISRISGAVYACKSTAPLQAAGLLTLAAFAKWMLAHPPGSLPAEIKQTQLIGLRQRPQQVQ